DARFAAANGRVNHDAFSITHVFMLPQAHGELKAMYESTCASGSGCWRIAAGCSEQKIRMVHAAPCIEIAIQ
ncbi:MAG: hypothetical protein ACREU0_09840, partial [Burkholderiales bacterium]